MSKRATWSVPSSRDLSRQIGLIFVQLTNGVARIDSDGSRFRSLKPTDIGLVLLGQTLQDRLARDDDVD